MTSPKPDTPQLPPRIAIEGGVYELVEFFDHDSQQYLIALRYVRKE